jgi:Xaa-Pro aminopeptidase
MLHLFINSSDYKKDPNIVYLTGYNPGFCILVYDDVSKKKCFFLTSFEVGMYKGIHSFCFSRDNFKKNIYSFFNKKLLNNINKKYVSNNKEDVSDNNFVNIKNKISNKNNVQDINYNINSNLNKNSSKDLNSNLFFQIGVNMASISVNELKAFKRLLNAKFIDNSNIFLKKRKIKNQDEIIKIKHACHLSDKILKQLVFDLKSKKFNDKLKNNLTEKDILLYLKKKIVELGSSCAFEPIVASNINSTFPHHISSDKKLNGFVLIDFGVKYDGYCSDITRMFYFGVPKKSELIEYNNILSLHKSVINSLKKGVKLNSLDNIVRKKIGSKFKHALGHGIGVEVHELPLLNPSSKEVLEEGMVFSIEPAIYIKNNFGIRVEDTISFYNNKIEILTKFPKKLIFI